MRLGRPPLLHGLDEAQLLTELENTQWQVRVAAIQKFEEYGERAPIESLIMALKDEHEAVRAAAAHALGVLQKPKAVTPLVEALQDPIWLVRAAVVQALGMLVEHAPVEPLMLALQDSAWQVREMALLALGTCGGDIPETVFTLALQDEDESVRRAALFLQENYPDRFAETATNLPADASEESTESTFDARIQTFPQAISQREGKQEQRGDDLLHLDQEQHLEYAVQHRNLRRYPRRGAVLALRWALLVCWSIFLGYLLGIIWDLVRLTHADPVSTVNSIVKHQRPSMGAWSMHAVGPTALHELLLGSKGRVVRT